MVTIVDCHFVDIVVTKYLSNNGFHGNQKVLFHINYLLVYFSVICNSSALY